MGFGEAIRSGFKRYVDFQGRSARSEYWWYTLFIVLVAMGLQILSLALRGSAIASIFSLLYVVFCLGTFLPSLGMSIRRLHDLDKSGWWVLIGLVPLVGGILLLVWYCTKGTTGENQFGADPLGAPASEVFA